MALLTFLLTETAVLGQDTTTSRKRDFHTAPGFEWYHPLARMSGTFAHQQSGLEEVIPNICFLPWLNRKLDFRERPTGVRVQVDDA